MKKIYIFSTQTNVREWQTVNDGVMGGISKSKLTLTNEGFGKFSGNVSLEYNGGFASVQRNTNIKLEADTKYVSLRIKGDKKRYEFRLKADYSQY